MIQQRWFHEKSHEEYPPDSQHPRLVPGEVYLQYRSIKWRVDAAGAVNVFPAPVEWTEWTTTPHVYEKAEKED